MNINESFINQVIQATDQKQFTDDRDNTYSFNSFTERFTTYFEKHFIQILCEKVSNNTKSIVRQGTETVWKLIYSIVVRTMILELHQWKAEVANEKNEEVEHRTSNEKYLMFCRRFRDEKYFREFCEKYVVLIRKIRNLVKHTLALYEDAVNAMVKDQETIQEMFQISIENLTNIALTEGDSHNQGKRALLFEFGEQKLIYKPHSLANDLFLEEIYEEFNQCLSLPLMAPKTITREHYGWQEFVEKKECATEEEYEKFYYRYGELVGLSYCLNMTDLHMENLIRHGEYPIIVDTETIILNDCYNFNQSVAVMNCDTPSKLMNRSVSKSVINTQLLPVNVSGGVFDIDLSPLAVDNEQKSNKMINYKVIEEFTDNIHIAAEYYEQEISDTKLLQHNACLYQKQILDGFTEFYTFILQNKNYYLERIEKAIARNRLVLRQVLRPTYVYGKFLDASNHPDYLQDLEKQRGLISKLKSHQYRNDPKMAMQADMEIASILNGDIPYFYVQADSVSLHSIYGEIKNFYAKTISDLVVERIFSMNKDDLLTQQRIIRLAMSTLIKSNWNHGDVAQNRAVCNYALYSSGNDKEIVQQIGDYLCHEAIWDDTKQFCIWLSHALLTPKLKVSSASFYLYDCGGSVLFLHYLAKETQNEKYRVVADGILQGFLYNQEYLALSAYNGIGSLLYIYYTLYKLWKEEKYALKYKQCLEQVVKLELTQDVPLDFVNGLSGMAVLMENLYAEERSQELLELAKKYTDYCIARIDEIELTGLAHGYSGILLAVAGFYHISKENKYYEEALKVIALENLYYDEQKNNWRDLREGLEESDSVCWCHGATGIGLARMKASKLLMENVCKTDLERALKKIKTDTCKLKNHSLCHGLFGNFDCFRSIVDALEDTDGQYTADVEEMYAFALADMKKNGAVCGISNAYEMFSFMLGIPGIAYAIMRKYNREIPNMLLLEF